MNLLERIFYQVVQTSLSATVLIGLAWLVIACFGKVLPPWARYGIWILVFLRLMTPVVPSSNFSIWNLGRVEDRAIMPVVIEPGAADAIAVQPLESKVGEETGIPFLPMLWLGGVVASIAAVWMQHRKLTKWSRRQDRCTDPRVLSMVDRARAAFGVRKQIVVLLNERFEAPAVFGWRRPCLLLPAVWLRDASQEELYGVLLHEMAHVKYRDALLNWLWIAARSMHWFNPLAWHAFVRLRAEREVFCDALVLVRVHPAQRTVYGATLIRIAAQLSGASAPSTLVPILQRKPEIHRRIHMIAKYKSTPWLISAAFIVLLTALAGLTFTRAAEKTAPATTTPRNERAKALDLLEKQLAEQQKIVRQLQDETSALEGRLEDMEASGSAEALQKLRNQKLETQAEFTRLSSLHKYLSEQSIAELRQSITTASPDAQLSQLMQQRDSAEQKLADLLEERTAEHPDIKRTSKVLAQINKQIEERIDGIVKGLRARVSAEEAHMAALDNALDRARQQYRENVQRRRPYEEAVRELRAQQELLQRLRLRMLDERVGSMLEDAKRN